MSSFILGLIEMKISDWLMLLAVLLGPIISVRLTRYLDNKKELRERKIKLFKILMGTRAYSTSLDHVIALNQIDLEFDKNNKNEKAVIDAWKEYLDILNDKNISPEQWNLKRIDLLVDLLYKMAQILNYDFDKTHIKNSSYAPMAHGNLENEQQAIRIGIIQILKGEREFPISISKYQPD